MFVARPSHWLQWRVICPSGVQGLQAVQLTGQQQCTLHVPALSAPASVMSADLYMHCSTPLCYAAVVCLLTLLPTMTELLTLLLTQQVT